MHIGSRGMYEGAGRDCYAKMRCVICWNTMPLAPVWNLIGQLHAMLLAMAFRITRSNQNWGSHTEFTVAQAGIKGVARWSVSAWRGKPADPPRMASRSSRSTGLHLRSHQLERGPK
jgi:hypothetical protein